MNLSPLLKFNLRYYRRHVLLSVLCLLGIALGVGIVVSVELINDSALSSFAASVDFLAGKASHSIVSSYGHIDEQVFIDVWKHPLVKAASPMIEVMATTLETGNEPIRFLGLDPFLDAPFRELTPGGRDRAALTAFLRSQPASAYLSGDLLSSHGLKPGNTITVLTAGVEKKVRILGALPGSDQFGMGESLAVMDIGVAQEVFDRRGQLDRIDVVVPEGSERLASELPSGLQLTDRADRKATLQSMLYSFQLNLAAMSLLALFVGIFLIYNFSMFSVLNRREDMSLLLTLGSARGDLVKAFILESLLLGTVGSLIGVALGYVIAWASMEKVSSTISELYFYVRAEKVRLTWLVILSGFGVGFFATFVGAALPSFEVAVTPPILGMKRRTIEDKAHALKALLFVLGLIFFGGAFVTWWAARFSMFWGWISAFCMTLAFAMFTPPLISPLTHYAGLWFKKVFRSLEAFMAARTIRASLSRTSIAVAALAVALAVTIGVDSMIHSFRESVKHWLAGALQGDLYVSPATTKWAHPLPESLIEQLQKDPDVAALERYSTYGITLNGRPARLRVIDAPVLKDYSQFTFLKGKEAAWEKMIQGGVFISESLGYHQGLNVGDSVALQTPQGLRSFPVVAVTRDYSSDQGTVQMDRTVYESIWHDNKVQSVALFLKPGASIEKARRSIVERFPGLDKTVVSNVKMREDIMVIFDKTFAPTATLKGVSLLVALLGVATALMAILIERSNEMTVLGYLGMTPRELGWINVYQALIMGALAFLIAVACGMFLIYIIVHAINYRSFGWSVDIYFNHWIFAKTFLLTMIACLASSIYPTYRLINSQVGRLLKEE
ncbi:MAG: FtsX-like permease family protein [Thermodesulfobacteriota bacterium]